MNKHKQFVKYFFGSCQKIALFNENFLVQIEKLFSFLIEHDIFRTITLGTYVILLFIIYIIE